MQKIILNRLRMLITFEGGEGSGKTTIIGRMAKFLREQGYEVLETREPGGTVLGGQVRNLVLTVIPEMRICAKAELMLYLTSRAQTVDEIIAPALLAGKMVLCDRFNDSTVVYQGEARGLEAKEVKRICDFVCGTITPDLTFFLDVDPKVGLQRTRQAEKEQSQVGEVDRIESEELSFHEKVRNGYLRIAAQEPERVVVINANEPLDKVCEEVLRVLTQCLKN